MRVLELFCGTKSVGKCCDELGWEVISVDIDKRFNPTHLVNILEFDYKQYPKDYFDIVWGSPPCIEYSKALTRRPRDIPSANKIVLKTIEIINYFDCEWWFIENPESGKLKEQPFMIDLPYVDGDYCMYGKPYRKRTRFWTNKKYQESPLKLCNKECGSFINGKHIGNVGCGNPIYTDKHYTKQEKYSIPPELIYSLFLSI